MTNIEDVNTPEFKEKVAKYNSDSLSKLFERGNSIKKISSNTDYIMWLNYFTITHPSFSDNDWLYFPEKINEVDNNHVGELNLLYAAIERYASKNYIYPIPCDFGGYYKIRLGGNGYEVGCVSGQGTVFFVNRVQIDNQNDFIDFNDIINNKEQPYVKEIDSQLEDLKARIKVLHENNIPFAAIEETIKQTLSELEKQEELQLKLK